MRIDDESRTHKYQKDPHREKQLRQLNKILAPLEVELTNGFELPILPTIFIVGAPRSATTLMAQMMTATGAFGYISNFVARFWMAPLIGARMELALGINNHCIEPTYNSFFGVTEGWSEPHEFGYFWERWFSFKVTHKLSPREIVQIDTRSLQKELAAIESVYNKPLFFKNLTCGLQISLLAALFPKSIFVVCLRQPLFNAQDLLMSKEERLGNRKHWFSLRPAEYPRLKELPCHEQVVAQIYFTMFDIQSSLEALEYNSRFTYVHYEDLCRQPKIEIARVIKLVEQHDSPMNWNVDFIPDHFRLDNEQKIDDHDFRLLRNACIKYFGHNHDRCELSKYRTKIS